MGDEVTDEEKTNLIEVIERGKTNIQQIEEIKDTINKLEVKTNQRIDKLDDKTEDIHRIALSIERISNDVTYMKQGQADLSVKVDKLSDKLEQQVKEIRSDVDIKVGSVSKKVDAVEKQPYEEYKKIKSDVKVKILVAIAAGVGIALITFFATMISEGIIKL